MDDKKLVCKADYEAAKARGSYTNIDLYYYSLVVIIWLVTIYTPCVNWLEIEGGNNGYGFWCTHSCLVCKR